MNILALSGSLRAASTNMALLEAVSASAPEGMAVALYRGLGDLPIFSPDREGEARPAAVLDLAARVEACDGIVIACPEYAHGIPGGLKNALDWLVSGFEIPGKPVMIAHSSHRGEFVLQALREVLKTMSVRLVEEAFVRVPLVGKKPDEAARILAAPETTAALRAALERFRPAITEARDMR
ncbi:MAG TPA: NADPH-dependent FMN reductase [Pararhizobium sp.]|nr:NADPH-dependent FMN reductase [Pararhizobium sp.]